MLDNSSETNEKGLESLVLAMGESNEKQSALLFRLRKLMRENGVGIYLVLMQDEHNSEYVALADKRIAYISGFDGSAGTAIIGPDSAELVTDSRYWVRAAKELYPNWQLVKDEPAKYSWRSGVIERAKSLGANVGVDARFISDELASDLTRDLKAIGLSLIDVTPNLIDEIWPGKPTLPPTPIWHHALRYSGQCRAEKLKAIRQAMAVKQSSSLIVYALDEIAWLYNLRGGDVPYTPIFKAFSVITAEEAFLYCDLDKAKDLLNHVKEVTFKPYQEFFENLGNFSASFNPKVNTRSGMKVWLPAGASWATAKALSAFKLETARSPISLAKIVKNPTEISGARDAQLKCSLSFVKYFSWLERKVHAGTAPNEYDGGVEILKIREKLPDFCGLSYESISAVGPNAASPHYAPAPENSAPIRLDQVYLLDSGSQFLQGTTDITRTVHFGSPRESEKRAYTLVLKGQLAVSGATFPKQLSGHDLDILARQFLWSEGWTYLHGSGHGVGSLLGVHELPAGIGMSAGPESQLVPGIITSIEPGFYVEGDFGIRLENEILVVPAKTAHNFNDIEYCAFETITLVPYDRNLIALELLTDSERRQINQYHELVKEVILPFLDMDYEREWLARHTSPL